MKPTPWALVAEALAEFRIETCDMCDGSGRERATRENACHQCGGTGETIHGGHPYDLRKAAAAVGIKL